MREIKEIFDPNLIVENDTIELKIKDQIIKRRFIKCFLFHSLKYFNYNIKESAAYIILNVSDGEFYIGSSSNVYFRILQHRCELNGNKHQSKKLQKSFNSTENHLFHISVIFTKDTEESLNIEQLLLEKFYLNNKCCNSHPNSRSSLGAKHSDETKNKISKIVSGREVSIATRQKLSIVNKGKKLSDAHRLKMSIVAKNRLVDYARLERMSKGNIGRKHSEETLHKKSLSASNRKPVKINNIEYQSISWAAKTLGLPIHTVYKRVKSKSNRFNNYSFI